MTFSIKILFINILLILIFPLSAFCQKTNDAKSEKPRHIAIKQIGILKDGALLVRLMTKSNSIEALRARGNHEQADIVERMQLEINKRTIAAFRENFDFCPVYFFFSEYTPMIKSKRLDQVVFLNDNLEPDSSIRLNVDGFLIAEFGKIEQDTGKHRNPHAYYHKDEEGVLQQSSSYYAGPVFGFDALVIRSGQFVQMKFGKFPYYVKLWRGVKSYDAAVMKINEKLHRFYNRHYQ